MTDLSGTFDDAGAAVIDFDKTLINKNISEGIGKRILLDQLVKLRPDNFIYGIKKSIEIKKVEKNGNEIEGLKDYFKVIGSKNIVTKEEYRKYARKVIERSELDGARDFLKRLKEAYDLEIFIVTTSDGLSAQEAVSYFGATDYAANPIVYDGEIVKGIVLNMYDGKTKLECTNELLEKYGIKLKECIAVGDSERDHEIMKNSGFSFASPLADEKTKEIADWWIKNYKDFLKMI